MKTLKRATSDALPQSCMPTIPVKLDESTMLMIEMNHRQGIEFNADEVAITSAHVRGFEGLRIRHQR